MYRVRPGRRCRLERPGRPMLAFGVAGLLALWLGIGCATAQNQPAQRFEPDTNGSADKFLLNAANLRRRGSGPRRSTRINA